MEMVEERASYEREGRLKILRGGGRERGREEERKREREREKRTEKVWIKRLKAGRVCSAGDSSIQYSKVVVENGVEPCEG